MGELSALLTEGVFTADQTTPSDPFGATSPRWAGEERGLPYHAYVRKRLCLPHAISAGDEFKRRSPAPTKTGRPLARGQTLSQRRVPVARF
jgi:hypothetical protein